MRILFAEDDLLSQDLGRRLLERGGHQVTVVPDGRQAVERAGRAEFDVIVMDLHMPELDGFEAARAVRERERNTGRHVPIIALTAAALDGDRERCLAAGMDAYVSKPVSRAELFDTIARVTGGKGEGRGNAEAPASFDEALVQRVDGDRALAERAAGVFLETYPVVVGRLREGLAARDGSTVASAAHRLKGALSNFPGTAAQEHARRLELLGRTGDLDEAAKAMDALDAALAELCAQLAAFLDNG